MTLKGAITELQNLIFADDVPMYYKGGIQKVIETIAMEFSERHTEKYCTNCKHNGIATDYKCGECQHMDKWEHRYADTPQTDCIIVDARFKAHCLNCAESGSYKCKRCDGEMYYKDTPQTDCTEPTECKGCTKHICFGCEHQAEKEAWRKAQTDCGWK